MELDENTLFISPAHNKGLVDAATKLVLHFEQHPLPHLEVQLFKPRRGWEREFTMQIVGRSVSIDTRSWRYHLFVYDDGEVELELVIPDEQRGLLATAAPTVFLDSEVGEELAMKLFAITVVCASDVEGSTIPIEHLHEQLDELLSKTRTA